MESLLKRALENVKLLVRMIKDDDERTTILEGVMETLLKFGCDSYISELIDIFGVEIKDELYKRLTISAAKLGRNDAFKMFFEKIPNEDKLEVLADVIVDSRLDEKELVSIVSQYIKSIRSVNYNDEDVCYNMALILSFLGDYVRSRSFTNSFCALIKKKELAFMKEFFEIMDEIKCAFLKMSVGDKFDGLRILRRVIPKVNNLDRAKRASLILEACDVASRYGFYDEAMKFLDYLESVSQKSASIEVIFENALKNKEDDTKVMSLVKRANMLLGKNVELLLRLSIILRKYNNEKWRNIFSHISPEEIEKVNLDILMDLIEEIADNDFRDMLDEILKVPIYWEDLKMKPELLFKYAYVLYCSGRISGGAKIFDDYINDILVTKERKLDPQFPVYYIKSFVVALKRFPDTLRQIDFDERLHEKLVSIEKEIPLPRKVLQLLELISDHRYKSEAVEKIAEEVLTKLRCVGIEKVITLVPEKERLEELITRVARKLAIEGDVTDAISCLDLISDIKKKLDVMLAMEHRCALKLCDELPGLLKMTIKTVNEAKGKIDVDPVEEAKIRLDLAIVFKFHGKEKDYINSLNEAIKRLESIKPKKMDDIMANKITAESYGYYAAALYVLGDERSDALLKEALKYSNLLTSGLRTRVLMKIITWLVLAGWYSAVFELLQLEGMEKVLPIVRTSLIKEYVKNERYEEALKTALSISFNPIDEIDTYINYAYEIARTPEADTVPEILEKAKEKCQKIEDNETKLRFMIRIASAYAKAFRSAEAEKIIDSILEQVKSISDVEKRDRYLALIVPVVYIIETQKTAA